MKSAGFEYAKPASVEEALRLKAERGDVARFLAGGQSLLPALNMRLDHPSLLIDLNGLAELGTIAAEDGVLKIGALARTEEIGRSELVRRHAPLLAKCVEHIAHAAIRTMGTMGGSVALADPAAEWPAACLALDAELVIRGPQGERRVAARDFFIGLYETALAENELLVRIDVPFQPSDARSAALELARRRGDYAIVGILAQGRPNDAGGFDDARIVAFAVADRPIRLRRLEEALVRDASRGTIEREIDAALVPEGDLHHSPATKKHLAKVLAARAVDALRS
jgi:carbon-monoxide dehydrogenase medium subunit